MKIAVDINRLVDKPDSPVKAFASIRFDGLYTVHGIRILENEKGRFVAMPSTSYIDQEGNKQYRDIFHPITKDARNALHQAVLNAYDFKLQQIQVSEIEIQETQEEVEEYPEPEVTMGSC